MTMNTIQHAMFSPNRLSKLKLPLACIKVPIIDWLPNYTQQLFMPDIAAGVTVFVFMVPQAMAYALVVGVPTAYGLYSATVPIFVYAILGTSREMSIGPMAITALLLGVSCQKYGFEEGSAEYIAVALNMSMLVGFILFILGICKLGALVSMISQPVLSGFISASAVVILVNQMKYLFGFHVPRFDYIVQTVYYILSHLHETNAAAALLGFLTWMGLFIVRKLKQREATQTQEPATDVEHCNHTNTEAVAELESVVSSNHPPMHSLIVTILYKILSGLGSASNFLAIVVGFLVAHSIVQSGGGIDIVGTVPSGMLSPSFVFLPFGTVMGMVPSALALSFVSFAGNWAIAKKFADEERYSVDATQELIAQGLANILGVVFHSFVVSGGLSRSAVNKDSGAKTQMASIITAICVLLCVFLFTSLLYYIPIASLGAIIQVSTVPLVGWRTMVSTYKQDKNDFFILMTTFLVTLFIGVADGLFVGIFLNIAIIMLHTAFPKIVHLGRITLDVLDQCNDAMCESSELLLRVDNGGGDDGNTITTDYDELETENPLRRDLIEYKNVSMNDEECEVSLEMSNIELTDPNLYSKTGMQMKYHNHYTNSNVAKIGTNAIHNSIQSPLLEGTTTATRTFSFYPQFVYRDVARYPMAEQIPGVAIVRMDASLQYANCNYLKEACLEAASGAFHTSRRPIKLLIIDASPWNDLDLSGIKSLIELKAELARSGVTLAIACAKGIIRDRFKTSGFLKQLSEPHLNMTIEDAISAKPRRKSITLSDTAGVKE